MGSNSSTSHQSYTLAPTGAPDLTDPTGAEQHPTDAPPPPAATQVDGPDVDEVMSATDDDRPSPGANVVDPEEPAEAEAEAEGDNAGPGDLDAAVTPVPAELQRGHSVGTAVLVGGADLVDSSATLVAYADGDTDREMLSTTVTPEAEAKIFEAIAASPAEMVPVQVEQMVEGRLPLDEHLELHEKLAAAAKTINHRYKNGAAMDQKALDRVATATEAVKNAEETADLSTDDQAMLAHYKAHLTAIQERYEGTTTLAYDAGGKIPMVQPYQHQGTALVTSYVPAPPPEGSVTLPTSLRPASRPKVTIDSHTGTVSWDGTRTSSTGSEYVIDLGDGYQAVYRPYAGDEKPGEFSLRGKLEITAPGGTGHSSAMVSKLGELNLVNRPMTKREGEYAYLEANIHAQGLGQHPDVVAARHNAQALVDLEVQEQFYSRSHQAVGMDAGQLNRFARKIHLDAEATVLPRQVGLVREAVAHATGHVDGAALAATPAYDPTPRHSGGWLTWQRFNAAGLDEATWSGKSLVHHAGGGALREMLTTGVLASTERRATMGVRAGVGMSEGSDKHTGGANSVFVRVTKSKPSMSGPALVWDDPARLLGRTDYYAYPSDHFGNLNPKDSHGMTGLTRDPATIAGFHTTSSNEVMFRDGLDLLGAEAPSRIVCQDQKQRQTVLDLLQQKGISHLAGKTIEDVVTSPHKGHP